MMNPNTTKKIKKHIENFRGFSLVEVMIAASIMAVVLLSIAQMTSNLNKEVQSVTEKFDLLNLEALARNVVANGSVCTFDLTNTTLPANPGNPQKFSDVATIPPLTLSQIHMTDTGAAPPLLTSVGSKLNNTLKITSIKLGNIKKFAPEQYKAELQIFATSSTARQHAPIKIAVVLQTDGGLATPGKETIIDCALSSSSSNGFVFLNPLITVSNNAMGTSWGAWHSFDASASIPNGVNNIILETNLANNWRVNWMEAKYRKNSTSPVLWLNRAQDDDSKGTTLNQGIYPLDPNTRIFDFWVNGSSGDHEIKIIGYFKS